VTPSIGRGLHGRARALLPVVVVVATTLGGCSWGRSAPDCRSVEEYQDSQDLPPVRVPEGLSKPEEPNRLKIPAGPAPQQPLAANAACLPRPPDYFRKTPPGAAGAESSKPAPLPPGAPAAGPAAPSPPPAAVPAPPAPAAPATPEKPDRSN
jgi:pilus assembly protein FimV